MVLEGPIYSIAGRIQETVLVSEAPHHSTRLETLTCIDAVYVRKEGIGEVVWNLVEIVFQERLVAKPVRPIVSRFVHPNHAVVKLFVILVRVFFVHPLQSNDHVSSS